MTNVTNGPTARATGDLTALVGQLAKRVDANGDGTVSTKEFGDFLTTLIASFGGQNVHSAFSATAGAAPAATSAAPGAPAPAAGTTTSKPVMPGWDPAKWADEKHVTPKYLVGRILSNYPPTPQGLKDALAEIQKALPGTTIVGDDKLDIPDVGKVDVGLAFKKGGGVGWWWGPQ
jgi:hypothetical protein